MQHNIKDLLTLDYLEVSTLHRKPKGICLVSCLQCNAPGWVRINSLQIGLFTVQDPKIPIKGTECQRTAAVTAGALLAVPKVGENIAEPGLCITDELVEKFTWLKELCNMWQIPIKSSGL